MPNILLFDSNHTWFQWLQEVLKPQKDLMICHADKEQDVLRRLLSDSFDIIICELKMIDFHIFPDIIHKNKNKVNMKLLVYTDQPIVPTFNRLLDIGISGFIHKSCHPFVWEQSIRYVLLGGAVLPNDWLKQLSLREINIEVKDDQNHARTVTFSVKDQEILQYLADGCSNHEISRKIHVSQRTLEYYLTFIYRQLNVSSRAEAVMQASILGIVSSNSPQIIARPRN